MERRSFIKKTGLGISGAILVPNAIASSVMPALVNSQYVPLKETIGQIRHGLLTLPQAGFKNSLISYSWLQDVSKNVFYENGFQEGTNNEDMEIISLLVKDPKTQATDAIQVQKSGEDVVVLREGDSQVISLTKPGFKAVSGKKLKNIKLEIGQLSGFKELSRKVPRGTEVYLQLLKGHMVVNDIDLEPGIGLCLSSMRYLHFKPTQACKFILLYHQT